MGTLRNKVQLIGKVSNVPEINVLESGRKMARFFIATYETYRNAKGERVKDNQWHCVVAWGKIAGLAEIHLSQGKEVGIGGKLNSYSYQDEDGVRHYVTEVYCHEILLLEDAGKNILPVKAQ